MHRFIVRPLSILPKYLIFFELPDPVLFQMHTPFDFPSFGPDSDRIRLMLNLTGLSNQLSLIMNDMIGLQLASNFNFADLDIKSW